jgi:hypothetical protein
MRHWDPGSAQCRRLEQLLCATIVVLKLFVLYRAWGQLQGFDAGSWLEVFRVTHWFEPLPPPRALLASYHPPLSYLLTRMIYWVLPNETTASQLLSTLALIGGFFGLRAVLRQIGWLYSLSGLWLLYGGFSMPLFVWLAVETGYDGLILTWYMLTFAVSVSLFWQPTRWTIGRRIRISVRLGVLVLLLVVGLFTKYNGLLAFALPFTIILVRRGPLALAREFWLPLCVSAIALTIVAPFYYFRYYETEHEWMPAAMEWQKPVELAQTRAKRDALPEKFLADMLRMPTESIVDAKRPVMNSFVHSIWFHIWKRDKWLGMQTEPSLSVSNFYVRLFPAILVAGTLLFLFGPRFGAKGWRQLGWVMAVTTLLFTIGALAFAWKYPIWGWRVFKAKYMSPAILWVAYAAAMPLSLPRFSRPASVLRRCAEATALIALVAFMLINHALPVY